MFWKEAHLPRGIPYSMKRRVAGVVLWLFASRGVWAEPATDFKWPDSYTRVKINGIEVDCEWRDGVPWVLGGDVAKITRTKLPDRSINLAKFLADQGYEVDMDNREGLISARDPHRTDSKASMNGSAPALTHQGAAVPKKKAPRKKQQKKPPAPKPYDPET
jgi:hypothetical protein